MPRFAQTLFVGALAVLCACTSAPQPVAALIAPEPQEKLALEARVYPPVIFEGDPAGAMTLAARQEHLGVPAISLAVYRGGELAWAETYGENVDENTLFQAASLSKMVAAAGIIALAQSRGVSLDVDISGDLKGLDPAVFNPGGVPMTLRGLLSHTNGANVHGFPGYAAGEVVPTTLEVLTAPEKANTDRVVITPNPDATFDYSGGGYTVAQLWAEQVSGEDFSTLMDRLVLDPIGMTLSTFERIEPGTEDSKPSIAEGYDFGAVPIEGGWHVYPELAAAGLWTTATEFGRFLAALDKGLKGEAGGGIDLAVAREMTTPVSIDYGLGIGIQMEQGEAVLRHSGSNAGYRSEAMLFPVRGDVFIAMTNSESGYLLSAEARRAAAKLYGWPVDPSLVRTRLALTGEQLAAYAGSYVPEGEGAPLVLEVSGQGLTGRINGQYRYGLVPVGDGAFIDPDDGQEARFAEKDGVLSLTVSERTYMRRPPE